jgi:hypothetical protein
MAYYKDVFLKPDKFKNKTKGQCTGRLFLSFIIFSFLIFGNKCKQAAFSIDAIPI